ncbi:hypothetical protein [uncultured Methanobrevibacter sp.]|uniref:hypothetical protein n=1 Tax=uncultured Methanobrevibacter sp. TaxID=253161 RepID=UPI0025F8665F|nr:hypothetical protein [uncultured Methanobrevibacter sp.]
MDTKNIIIICLAIIIVVMAIGLGFVIGQQGTAHKANVTNASNTVNNTSSVNVEKINTENTANSNQESSKSSDWVDSDGFHHYYENGKEYVGSREGQHMDIDTHNYVKEHGMGD